jgi:hypothetical protein
MSWKLKQFLNRRLGAIQYVLMRYTSDERVHVLQLANRVRNQVDLLLDDSEACQLFNAVRQTAKLGGDLAEVGVYRGGSAKLICEAKGDRPLHLFDTFDGLPDPSALDERRFQRGQYAGSFEAVQRFLAPYAKVYLHKGFFPRSGEPVADKQFAFVHLDVDLYESTVNALDFFYPRLKRGAVLISHDYNNVEGVRTAIDEFFLDKPELVLEVALSQAIVIKV